MKQTLNLAVLAGYLAAQSLAQSSSTTTVTLLLPGLDKQTVLGSVITAGPTATSYLLTCPTDAPDDECGLGSGFNFLQGPSTLELHATMGDTVNDLSCVLSGDNASCDQTSKGPAGQLTAAMNFMNIGKEWPVPVTVTAGVEKLAAVTASASTTTQSSSSTAPTGSDTAGAASSSRTSTAGMAAVTGNAVVAGVVAVLGGMLVV
jgi:hypothetical protein